MSEDPLLRSLGRLAREEDEAESARLDERWDRLAAGTLTPEEEAELRALAATSPEAREIYEAFRPLDAGFQARVVDAITREREDGAPAPERPEPPPRTLPFRRGGARLGWLVTAGLAAASLLLFLLVPSAQLPTYTASLEGGDQSLRGPSEPLEQGRRLFSPGSTLTVVGKPSEPTRGLDVDAEVYFKQGERIVPWEPKPFLKVDEDTGSLRLRGPVELPAGSWDVWLVVGRPGDLPPPGEIERELRAERTEHDDWRAHLVGRIESPP